LLWMAGVRTQGRCHVDASRSVRAGIRASGAGQKSACPAVALAKERAIIVVMKRGNARGARGGRKVERWNP
jgi:hypothetical protein